MGAVAVEEILGGLTGDDTIRDLVRVSLVRVARFADAAFQLYAAALLDDVSGFMRGGVKVRRTPERDVVSGGVRLRADRAGPAVAAPSVCASMSLISWRPNARWITLPNGSE